MRSDTRAGARAARAALMLALLVGGSPLLGGQGASPQGAKKATAAELLEKANTLFIRGDYEGARKYYLEALPSSPKNFDLLKNLAFCYYTKGGAGFAEAARYYRRAYEINPNSPDVAERLVVALTASNLPGEAAAILRKRAEQPGAPADLWRDAAEAYADAGQMPNAESAYRMYFQRNPSDLEARTALGRHYARRRDYARAVAQFRSVLTVNPNFAPALNGTARVLSWQGQFDESLKAFDRVLRSDPMNGEAQTGKAFVLLWMDRRREAVELFTQLRRRYPRDAEIARGLRLAQSPRAAKPGPEGQRGEAAARGETYYRAQLAKNPSDLDALRALAELTGDPKRCAESVAFIRKALGLSPRDPLLELRLGRSLVLCGQEAEAIPHYRTYLETQRDDPRALAELGLMLARARRTAEAIEVLRRLVALSPQHVDGRVALAQSLATEKQYPEALQHYDAALQASPENYDALQGKAFVLFWTRDYAQARAIFQRLAAQRPEDKQNTVALENIARAEEEARWAALRPATGAPPQAFVGYYQKRLESYPNELASMKGLAYAQEQLNDLPGAVQSYERVLAAAPDDPTSQAALARLYSRQGSYDLSLKYHRAALASKPDDQELLEGLGHVLVWSDHPREALGIYQRLYAAHPSGTGYLLEAARLQIQLGDYPAARDSLTTLVSAEPQNRDARLRLAQLAFTQRDFQHALNHYDALVQQDPKDPNALMGKAQILYYQGDVQGAHAAASTLVETQPNNFDAVFLLATIEHARARRRQTKELLNRAERISPGNSEVAAMKQRVRDESTVTIRTSASAGREIGPASEETVGAFGSFPSKTLTGLPNEDLRLQTYSTTIGMSLVPRVDSYFSFTSLPTQSPPLPIRDAQGNRIPTPITGAVAPWIFVSRHSWRPSKYLTIRGGAGVARFGPPKVERAVRLTGDLADITETFGSGVTQALDINPEVTETFEFKPVGLAGLTVAPSKKFSIDLDWNRSPAVYLPTPFAMKRRLSEERFRGGLNVFFTPRTELHFDFFYTRLFTDAQLSYSLENARLAVIPPSEICTGGTPLEISTTPTTRVCLGGQLVREQSVLHDWGHGGAITFNQIVVKSEGFSLDAGYDGTMYGFAGRERRVFLGFFNPAFYQNHMLTGRIYGKLFGPVGYDFSGGLGLQQTGVIVRDPPTTRGGALTRSGRVTPSFSFKVSPQLTLGIAYTHYNTAQILGPLRGNVFRLTTDWKF